MIALVGILLTYSYNQIAKEEVRLWEGIAENTFNQTQATISNFLLKEDARSFTEYRYYYIPETQLESGFALNISPLASLPENNSNGLIGYFQINPDASLHTPYLPPQKDYHKLTDLNQRKKLQENLKKITQSLQNDVKTENKEQKHFADLSALPKPPTIKTIAQPASSAKKSKKKARAKLYSAPSKKSTPEPMTAGFSGTDMMETEEAFDGDAYKQEVTSNRVQYQTFQEQQQEILPEADQEMRRTDTDTPSIFTDPFRARLVGTENMIFYRRIWANNKMYIQGFAVNTSQFFTGIIQNSFSQSALASFAKAYFSWENTILASTRKTNTSASHRLFERQLGYPLNQVIYRINYTNLSALISRTFLNILTALLLFMTTIGLYIIYRSAASQVILSQKRQDFVSAITHELKTPLTSIRMYSEMLTEGWAESENKKKEYYGLISSESDRLSRLIENVLQLSRLEKMNYRYHFETKDPKDDFIALANEFKLFCEKHGFQFKQNLSDNLPNITYDCDALKQVLYTLIDNSIKFTTDQNDKIIEMSLLQEKETVMWSITDHGPGVEPKEQNKIFTKFYRTENEQTRKTKGTGIGLAMAKMLVEGMGACIEAANQKPQGLTVTLSFSASIIED